MTNDEIVYAFLNHIPVYTDDAINERYTRYITSLVDMSNGKPEVALFAVLDWDASGKHYRPEEIHLFSDKAYIKQKILSRQAEIKFLKQELKNLDKVLDE